MAKKFSEMDAALTLGSSDIIPVVDSNGDNKTVTGEVLGAFVTETRESQSLNTSDKTPVGAINELVSENTTIWNSIGSKANKATVADDFSTASNYAIGDYCLYGNTLYRFTAAKTAGAWDSSKVTEVKIGNELKAKQDSLSVQSATVTNNVIPSAGSFQAYKYGKLCMVSGFAQYSSNQSSGTTLFTVSETFNAPYFTSAITSSGAGVRLKLNANGKVELESALNASQWMSISMIGILA